MIKFKSKGSFDKTTKFLSFIYRRDFLKKLDTYGQMGVDALRAATPIDSGATAESWSYEIKTSPWRVKIYWINSNTTPDGTPIVILLEYGHGLSGGGYVQGKDFINSAAEPVFKFIADNIWREVVNA